MKSQKYYVVTGGGTGGHVFPAIAIYQAIQDKGGFVRYFGNPQGMEAQYCHQNKLNFVPIDSIQIKNINKLKILLQAPRLILSIVFCLFKFIRQRPHAVIGVGGYVSGPVILAAALLFIPIYIQEQNISVGIANRFLGRFAKKIFLGFPQATSYFNPQKVLLTGNPLRKEFYTPSKPLSPEQPKTLLIFGGSQGSLALNKVIIEILPKLWQQYPHLKVTHQTGKQTFDQFQSLTHKFDPNKYQLIDFIENMFQAYNQADLVVSRSGALTVTELIQVRKPSILIPYPRKGQNDQLDNALYLQDKGVSHMVVQNQNLQKELLKMMGDAISHSGYQKMTSAFEHLEHPKNPLALITNLVMDESHAKEPPIS